MEDLESLAAGCGMAQFSLPHFTLHCLPAAGTKTWTWNHFILIAKGYQENFIVSPIDITNKPCNVLPLSLHMNNYSVANETNVFWLKDNKILNHKVIMKGLRPEKLKGSLTDRRVKCQYCRHANGRCSSRLKHESEGRLPQQFLYLPTSPFP